MRVCASSLLMFVVVSLTGCDTEGNHAEAVCAALCDCRYALSSVRQACVNNCVADAPAEVPDACVECALTASCVELAAGTCADACTAEEEDDDDQRSGPLANATKEMP